MRHGPLVSVWKKAQVNGCLMCVYLCVQGSAVAVSVQGDGGHRYNDGQWHSITATRRGAVGTIVVNNQYSGNSSQIHTDRSVCA